MQWIIRQDNRHHQALIDAFTHYLGESIPYGEVLVTNDLKGCAIWLPPGVWSEKPPLVDYLMELFYALGWSGLGRINRFIETDNNEYNHKPAEPHYYLAILGVHPDYTRKGYASTLLEQKLEKIDQLGYPAYLENSNKVNQSLYERHGFKIIDSFTLRDGPTEWCMLREPVNRLRQKA